MCTPDRKRVFYARPGVGCSVILLRSPGLADNVVTLPLPEREWSEQDVDKIHAEAFRDLEVEVGDLERMGQIAQDCISRCVAREDGRRNLDLSTFAVTQLAKMLREFKDRYYKRWHGDPGDES